MEKKDRVTGFILSVAAIVLIAGIVYCNYKLEMNYRQSATGYPQFFAYFINMLSAFLSSLLLQGEEILKIIRQRKALFVRWELIPLGIAAFLLGFVTIWFYLLFPNFQPDRTNPGFFDLVAAGISVGYLLDIAFIFAAGMFFVRVFSLRSAFTEKKDRINGFLYDALALPLVCATIFLLFNIVGSIFAASSVPDFIRVTFPFIGIFFTLVCALLLQGEEISRIIRRRKLLFIRWEQMIPGIVVLLAVMIVKWPFLHSLLSDYSEHSRFLNGIINGVIGREVGGRIYIFAAGMLLIRSFYINADTIQGEDGAL